MDYKEKYESALKRARIWKDKSGMPKDKQGILDDIFPELKESEDEKIKRILINYFKKYKENEKQGIKTFYEIPTDDILAWLEKQGEQKEYTFKSIPRLLDMIEPTSKAKTYCQKLIDALVKERYTTDAKIVGECLKQMNGEDVPMAIMDEKQGEQKPDMVERKFKVGDWVVFAENHNSIYQVERIDNYRYYLRHYLGGTLSVHFDNELIRLWTIKDAKDGDILCCESGWTCIFKSLNSDNISFNSYCFMDKTGWFCETGSEGHTLDENFIKAYNGKIYPATKEQRELLFKKMHEAGYMWDSNSKQLLSLKAEPSSEQKPTEWSEEDEYQFNTILHDIDLKKKN